jgi:hypothetical protein
MADQSERSKETITRKLRKEQNEPAPSTQQAVAQAGIQPKMGGLPIPSRLEKGITELQDLHELLLAGDLDPRILEDFRTALNRVRTAAWAAQQYVARRETNQDLGSVLSFLAGERIRATYQLCQAISDDLKQTDIEVQAGSLVQLHAATRALTEQMKGVIARMG